MGREAQIIGHATDWQGEVWDVRERRQTSHGFDILIGWPAGEPRGKGGCGPGTILTVELAHYLANTRLRDIELPVSESARKRLRGLIGVRWSWDEWWSGRTEDLQTLTLDEFCRRHGCSMGAASQRRANLLRNSGMLSNLERSGTMQSRIDGETGAAEMWEGLQGSFSLPAEFWWAACLRKLENSSPDLIRRDDLIRFVSAELKSEGLDGRFLEERSKSFRRRQARATKLLEIQAGVTSPLGVIFGGPKIKVESLVHEEIADALLKSHGWQEPSDEDLSAAGGLERNYEKSVTGAVNRLIVTWNERNWHCPLKAEFPDNAGGPDVAYYEKEMLIRVGKVAASLKGE